MCRAVFQFRYKVSNHREYLTIDYVDPSLLIIAIPTIAWGTYGHIQVTVAVEIATDHRP